MQGYNPGMLFFIKNKLFPMQILIGVLVLGAIWLRDSLGLRWDLDVSAEMGVYVVLGLGLLFVSDAVIHGLLMLTLRGRYLNCYGALVKYYLPQKFPVIVVAGLLAGAEELVFRGLVLEGMLATYPGLSPWIAIAVSAVLFGLCHAMPAPVSWPFTVWAVWEGMLLGVVYVLSGSLLACVIAHAVHDVVGFGLFAWQRKSGWGMGEERGQA
jgi:membrane protease YdiL (CAAX protease family)